MLVNTHVRLLQSINCIVKTYQSLLLFNKRINIAIVIVNNVHVKVYNHTRIWQNVMVTFKYIVGPWTIGFNRLAIRIYLFHLILNWLCFTLTFFSFFEGDRWPRQHTWTYKTTFEFVKNSYYIKIKWSSKHERSSFFFCFRTKGLY